jgi:hypothetical protein
MGFELDRRAFLMVTDSRLWRRHFLNRLLPSHSSRHGAPEE